MELKVSLFLEVHDPFLSRDTVDHLIRAECQRFFGETFGSRVRWEVTQTALTERPGECELSLRCPAFCADRLIAVLTLASERFDHRFRFLIRSGREVTEAD